MKKSKIVLLTAAAFAAQWFNVPSAKADERYPAVVSATVVATNGTGGLSYARYGNRQIIQQCAREEGETNLMGLKLVYNRTADTLEVVKGTNQTVVCTPFTFHGGVSLSKTNGTVTERLALVFLDSNPEASGTLRATESVRTYSFGTNHFTSFRLFGQLQYATPAAGTNAAKIYSGQIVAGSFRSDMDDEDEGGEPHGSVGWSGAD